MRFLCVFCIFIWSSSGAKLPSNFKKCNRNQPDLKECLLEAAQYGISQLDRSYKRLKLPSIEPLNILDMSTHVDSGVVHLTEHLSNCKFYGMTKPNLKSFDFDLKQRFLRIDAVFPQINTSCHYVMNGTLLGVKIEGRGPSQLHFTNFHMSLHMTYDELKRHNKTYVKIATSKFEGKPEGIVMKLEGLFDGDKEASERVLQLINDNWSVLYDDIQQDYLEIPNQLFKQLAGNFFSRLSLEDLFD